MAYVIKEDSTILKFLLETLSSLKWIESEAFAKIYDCLKFVLFEKRIS